MNREEERCAFYGQTEKLALPEVERLLLEMSGDMRANHKRMDVCLSRRKHLLREMFVCTPDNAEGLRRMAILVKDRMAMLHDKGNQLCAQMYREWQGGGNKPFTDFCVGISLTVCFNDAETSVLDLGDDGSGSDYVKMAEVLSDFYHDAPLVMLSREIHYDEGNAWEPFRFADVDGKVDEWREDLDQFPELRDIPSVLEFHNLVCHSHYALQDIIRVNDVWSEAKVAWQHIAGQNRI